MVLISLNNLARLFMEERKYKQAEMLLRESLAGWEETAPDKMSRPTEAQYWRWKRYHTQSLLGASLTGQMNYGEAEALLLSGYEGLLRERNAPNPRVSSDDVEQAAVCVVRLYQEWGKPEQAAAWTLKLQEIKPSVTPKNP